MSEATRNGERTRDDDAPSGPESSEAADPIGPVSRATEEELAGELKVLAEENRRLRAEYARARRMRHRRSAFGLVALGILAALTGVMLPDARTVLFALAGTGLFTGVLTYYLTPERFLAAAIGRDIYTSLADNEAAVVTELGLQDTAVYVPSERSRPPPAWLFVPHRSDYEVPDDDALSALFVVTETERARGVSFHPSGAPLHEEFDRALADDLATEPAALADQLVDGLVEQFELAESASIDVDPEGDRVSIGVTGSAYGELDRFDHPIESFLGVGFARGRGVPVTVETTPADDRADTLVTCRWSD